jgi:5'-3' exonuclease, N-terminal resolvase-like domain
VDKYILFDADVLVYRCAWAEKDSDEATALLKMDELIGHIYEEVDPYGTSKNRKFFLTGKGNFRYDIAKTAVYKGNRKDTEKPKHFAALRDYLIFKYDAIVTQGCEADDAIGIHANYYGYDRVVIVSIDKDFEQLPTTIFNPSKWEWKTVDTWTATKNFYKQILMGDRVDNIIGLYGIGPVKAEKLLEGCDSEKALYAACVEAYYIPFLIVYNEDALGKAKERVLENARLLWIQRYNGELWEPPV